MKKNTIVEWMIIVVFIAIFALGVYILFFAKRKEEKTEDITGLELEEDMEVAHFVPRKEDGEIYGAIQICADRTVDEWESFVSAVYGDNHLEDEEHRPHHDEFKLWEEMNQPDRTIYAYYFRFQPGENAKTREIEIYVVGDGESDNSLYIFY